MFQLWPKTVQNLVIRVFLHLSVTDFLYEFSNAVDVVHTGRVWRSINSMYKAYQRTLQSEMRLAGGERGAVNSYQTNLLNSYIITVTHVLMSNFHVQI